MPLDALTRITLNDAARMLDIEPIPAADLDAYRNDMLRRHPGSRWGKYPNLVGLLVPLSVAFAAVVIGISTIFAVTTLYQFNLTFGIAMLSGSTGVAYFYVMCRKGVLSNGLVLATGPAYWLEVKCGNSLFYADVVAEIPIPDAIRTMAAQLIIGMRDTEFVIGKLRQNFVTIDPYLIVRQGTHEIILGIWDENGIVRQAIQR